MTPTPERPTPGPWTFEPRVYTHTTPDDVHVLGIQGPNGEDIVVTDSGYYPPKLADARLIAAAPDLLAALERAVALAEAWIEGELGGTSLLDGELAKLQPCYAALAKARGVDAH